jgi:cytochrome c peroxidase
MKTYRISALLFLVVCVFEMACKKEPVSQIPVSQDAFDTLVSPYLSIERTAPSYDVHLPSFLDTLQAFQPEAALAQLGRILFYEKKFSADGSLSCAGCHHQEYAFAEPLATSIGVFGRTNPRNALALGSNPWFAAANEMDADGNVGIPLFWDHRALNVTDQSIAALTNEQEMDVSMEAVLAVVEGEPYYQWLIEQAYGDGQVSEERIFKALTHFMGSMSSANSHFDQAFSEVGTADMEADFPGFTAEENLGKSIYLQHCNLCHGSLNNRQQIFEANNGLENPYVDKGKQAISGLFYEHGVFRVPGLRNIARSAPYMHDGRFGTLLEVVNHYDSGVVRSFGLHGDLLEYNEATGNYDVKRLNLTEAEKNALVAFLHTLTDESFLNDVRFSDPFK